MAEQPGEGFWGAPPTIEFCYRHPKVQTAVHCTRCERPICPECMTPAPVGYQCPECVQQARREFRSGRGARRIRVRNVTATKVLLAAMFAMFVVEVLVGGADTAIGGPSSETLFRLGAMYPPAIANGQYWRLFSAIFLHIGFLHIAFNAYALWLFGPLVEQAYGRTRFLAIFFVTGFVASAASYAFGPLNAVGAGASGAIFGVFGAFIAYNWRRRDLALAAANLRLAVMLIVLNIALAIWSPAIDWRAHVGGLISGVVAGTVAEGFGTRQTRTAVAIGGFAALIVVGAALVAWRTADIRAIPGFHQAVAFFGS